MSTTKSDLRCKLEETTPMLLEHLIKLYLYPNCEYVNHWKQECYNFLHNVSRLKRSNKLPSAKFILDSTININSELIPYYAKGVMKDYAQSLGKPTYDIDKLEQKIFNYYEWLAEMLSKYGRIFRTDCYEKLDELFLE